MKSLLKNNLRFIAGILAAIMIVMLIAPLSGLSNSTVNADENDSKNNYFVALRWAMIRNKQALDAGEIVDFDVSPYGITYKDIIDYQTEFMYTYTDFYFAHPTYILDGRKEDRNDDTPVTTIRLTPIYTLEEQNKLDAAIAKIISLIPAGASDFDKALFVHDYICTHTIYDPDIANYFGDGNADIDHPNSYTAYGCLVEGLAVCSGYARAYKMIMDQLGIPCVITISEGMNHCWNIINIDKEWYHVDTTWDDPTTDVPGKASHRNFLKSDEGIVEASFKKHTGWVTPIHSTSTIYDDKNFWLNKIDSQIQFVNGNYVYSKRDIMVLGNPGYYQYLMVSRTHEGKESTLFEYKMMNGFLNDTSFTCILNGYLYYNNSTQIIRYSLANKTSEVIFEDPNLSIIAFYPDADAKTARIEYQVPDGKSLLFKSITLSETAISTGTPSNTVTTSNEVEIKTTNYTLSSKNELYCFPEIAFEDGSTEFYFKDEVPSVTPTPEPTETPVPTTEPTVVPTSAPTEAATATPSAVPTATPSAKPTAVPTTAPTTSVPESTVAPTTVPSATPTSAPTKAPETTVATTPTAEPTSKPEATEKPSATTTPEPTESGVAGFTERLYTTCLGRDSEADGKAYWIDELGKGISGADVAKLFFFSPEFEDLKLDNKEYITRLYKTFMDREPEEAGLDYWTKEMNNGKDREFVFDGFVNSPEWAGICKEYGIKPVTLDPVSAFAERLYETCLGRDADDAGVKYWANEIAVNGASASEVARFFFFSDEFIKLDLNNKEYVTRLYKTIMNREPEDDGLVYWAGQLSTSISRESVFDGFANSPEWEDICNSYGITK